MKHEQKLIYFDLMRGSAAILVFVGHLRALTLDDFTPNHGILVRIFYFITGYGHQAVIIFFVLSGFFIVKSIHETIVRKNWNPLDYVNNRVVRLWVVLIPALFLTLFWDKMGLHFFKDAYTYKGTITYLPNINPTNSLGIKTFLGNLFFMQRIKTVTFGSNTPLWSLSFEFWYYALFPLLYFSLINFYSKSKRIILLILALLIFYFIGTDISLYFLIWLIGGLVYFLIKKNYSLIAFNFWKLILSLSLFLMSISFMRFKLYPLIFNDFTLAIFTGCLLLYISKLRIQNSLLNKTIIFFSNISYTVYLTHLPFAIFLVTFFLKGRMVFSTKHVLFYTFLFAIILGYCYLIYFLFERRTGVIKKKIKLLFQNHSPIAPNSLL
jgi:peptidoglycan/LPS O-acetylase OafA/YrhL